MPRMGWLALTAASAATLCLALPWPGLFVALGLAIWSIGSGITGWRRRRDPGPARLAGAGAITLGALTLLLGSAKYVLTLLALSRLQALL
ncbi:MAG TPA: hypothetical protein VL172_01730 [Kofleriaceae bacterium]|nr:hypothetical protein [Kofleriaceae bacterium]